VIDERIVRRALIVTALLGLAAGVVAYASGKSPLAHLIWAAATVPVVIALAVSMTRDLLQDRVGVDAIAFLSMTCRAGSGPVTCWDRGRDNVRGRDRA
jgi:Flp pilus assembly protein TadB